MNPKLPVLRATLLAQARKLGTDASEYDRDLARNRRAGPGPIQRMLSDGRVSSVNQAALSRAIDRAEIDVKRYRALAADDAGVTRELTTWRHTGKVGRENDAQVYGAGGRENDVQKYGAGGGENAAQRTTEVEPVLPTPEQVAARRADYSQLASRATTALDTLVAVKEAVDELLPAQSPLERATEKVKDILFDPSYGA